MRWALVAASLAAATLPAAASAQPKAAAAPTKADAPPPPPAPALRFTVSAPTAAGPWTMRVENTGDVPVRLVADARLVSLELTPPPPPPAATPAPPAAAKPKPAAKPPAPLRCALPVGMRPTSDIERAIVLPPKRAYSEAFEPRLYCFGKAEQAALAAGATVVARYGWTPPAPPRAPWMKAPPPSAPFVAAPIPAADGAAPSVSPAKELTAAPLTLGGSPPAPAAATPPSNADAADPSPTRLRVSSTPHVDAGRPFEMRVTVSVVNEGARPVTLRFSAETVRFDVLGPTGAARCGGGPRVLAPVREAFTTLAPKAQRSVTLLLDAVCSGHVFDRPGLFIVRPAVDTRGTNADAIGLRVFEGDVTGRDATWLRLHHGRLPPTVVHPRLEP